MAAFNILPSILDKTPYGGYRTGMADERAIMHSDRMLLNQDLDNQKQQMVNKDFESAGPLRAAERALKLAEAEKLQSEMNNGTWESDRQRQRQKEMEDLASKVSKRQLDELKLKVAGTEAISQIFPDMNPAAMAAGWDNARNIAKEYKFDIGDYNEQNAAKLSAMIKATPQAQKMVKDLLDHQQAIELKNLEFGQRYQTEWLRQDQATKRTGIIQAGANARTAAKDAAAAGKTPPLTISRAWENLKKGTYTETDIAVLDQKLSSDAQRASAADPEQRMLALERMIAATKGANMDTTELELKRKQLLEEFKKVVGGDAYVLLQEAKQKLGKTNPPKMSAEDREANLQGARDALKKGKSRAAVEQALRDAGIDPKDL